MSKFPEKQPIYCIRYALSYLKKISTEGLDERQRICLSDSIDNLELLLNPEYLPF